MENDNILVTGGSGLLGSKLQELMPNAWYPQRSLVNIDNFWSVEWFINTGGKKIDTLVHLAAYTSPPRVDSDPVKAMITNISATAEIVRVCAKYNIYLIYMSTDYVFKGNKGVTLSAYYHEDEGLYKEEDELYPVNKYAWSKLGGECAVRMYDNSLIIRTSFGPEPFPYEKAFIDQYTSREYVSKTAKKLVNIIKHEPKITGVLHIGGKRQTVFDYAKETRPDVLELSKDDVHFAVPGDTSLICDRYDKIFGGN